MLFIIAKVYMDVTQLQLRIHISFLLSGLKGSLNTSIEIFILLGKVMQVETFSLTRYLSLII